MVVAHWPAAMCRGSTAPCQGAVQLHLEILLESTQRHCRMWKSAHVLRDSLISCSSTMTAGGPARHLAICHNAAAGDQAVPQHMSTFPDEMYWEHHTSECYNDLVPPSAAQNQAACDCNPTIVWMSTAGGLTILHAQLRLH